MPDGKQEGCAAYQIYLDENTAKYLGVGSGYQIAFGRVLGRKHSDFAGARLLIVPFPTTD